MRFSANKAFAVLGMLAVGCLNPDEREGQWTPPETDSNDDTDGEPEDQDGDGFASDLDCDDLDPSAFPGNPEVCDSVDNDCDGSVDEDATDAPVWYLDADSDGYGDTDTTIQECGQPSGYAGLNDDCDDADATVNPGAAEAWDGVDCDCDGYDLPPVVAVAVGAKHACVITEEGEAVCTVEPKTINVGQENVPDDLVNPSMISAGFHHSCALDGTGRAHCWGAQDGSSYDQGQSDIPDAHNYFDDISAGGYQTCGIETNGSLTCWGSEGFSSEYQSSAVQVASGYGNACYLDDRGSISCWGEDAESWSIPGVEYQQISLWYDNACALDVDGYAHCWPDSDLDAPGYRFTQIDVGYMHACGCTTGGGVECWGRDVTGHFLEHVPTEGTFSSVGVGSGRACAITVSDHPEVVCWE